jgi:hypothetical protein
MFLDWVYDLPNWIFCPLTMTVWVAFGLAGLRLMRPLAVSLVGPGADAELVGRHNELVSYFMSAAGVFYGITLGLVAVGTWTTYTEVEARVEREAAEIAALYRDISSYPEPVRSRTQALLREYTDHVIDHAWPQQRIGAMPTGGDEILITLQKTFAAFDPATNGDTVVHAEVFAKFNDLVEGRSLRLQAVRSGLPGAMWALVVFGGVITLGVGWFFVAEKRAALRLLTGLLAALVGLLVFIMVEMDRPFRGGFGISAAPYELVRSQLMEGGL